MTLPCGRIIWEFNAQGTYTGETMEKTKTRPDLDNKSGQVRSGQVRSGQVRSGQVRSEQFSFLIENITLPDIPGAVCKMGKWDRKGA